MNEFTAAVIGLCQEWRNAQKRDADLKVVSEKIKTECKAVEDVTDSMLRSCHECFKQQHKELELEETKKLDHINSDACMIMKMFKNYLQNSLDPHRDRLQRSIAAVDCVLQGLLLPNSGAEYVRVMKEFVEESRRLRERFSRESDETTKIEKAAAEAIESGVAFRGGEPTRELRQRRATF